MTYDELLIALRELRSSAQLNRAQMAELLGCKPHWITMIERGGRPNATKNGKSVNHRTSLPTLERYAQALGATITVPRVGRYELVPIPVGEPTGGGDP